MRQTRVMRKTQAKENELTARNQIEKIVSKQQETARNKYDILMPHLNKN